MQEAKKTGAIVENPNQVFYTLQEVAQHGSEDNCWTIFQGKIYDVTDYAKVHPGGKKIFLSKGKDCTDLFNQYHPWVNTQFLIGKSQVGVLKNWLSQNI